MKPLIFVCLFLSVLSKSYSQDRVLMMTKKSNGKEVVIKGNQKIKIKTKMGEVYRGNFLLKADSLYILSSRAFAFEEIAAIRTKPKGVNTGGAIATVLGGVGTVLGTLTVINIHNNVHPIVAVYSGLVIYPITTTPLSLGIVLLAYGSKFEANKWDYSIKTLID